MNKPNNFESMKLKDKVDCIADAVYNHIPTKLSRMEQWANIRFGFLMGFIALLVALLGVIVMGR